MNVSQCKNENKSTEKNGYTKTLPKTIIFWIVLYKIALGFVEVFFIV